MGANVSSSYVSQPSSNTAARDHHGAPVTPSDPLSLIAQGVQLVSIHDDGTLLQPRCNIRFASFARPTPAHRRRPLMTLVATLMLTAIALYVLVQVDDLRS